MQHPPEKTFANPDDGNTYYWANLEELGKEVLWACPTMLDGSADFEGSVPETAFEDPISPEKRRRIVDALRG